MWAAPGSRCSGTQKSPTSKIISPANKQIGAARETSQAGFFLGQPAKKIKNKNKSSRLITSSAMQREHVCLERWQAACLRPPERDSDSELCENVSARQQKNPQKQNSVVVSAASGNFFGTFAIYASIPSPRALPLAVHGSSFPFARRVVRAQRSVTQRNKKK